MGFDENDDGNMAVFIAYSFLGNQVSQNKFNKVL